MLKWKTMKVPLVLEITFMMAFMLFMFLFSMVMGMIILNDLEGFYNFLCVWSKWPYAILTCILPAIAIYIADWQELRLKRLRGEKRRREHLEEEYGSQIDSLQRVIRRKNRTIKHLNNTVTQLSIVITMAKEGLDISEFNVQSQSVD